MINIFSTITSISIIIINIVGIIVSIIITVMSDCCDTLNEIIACRWSLMMAYRNIKSS